MLRILLISPNYPPNPFTCGVGAYSQQVARHENARGHHVEILASNGYSGPLRDDRGVRVVRFSSRWGLFAGIRLAVMAAHKKYDLISLQSTPALYRTSFRLMLPLVNLFIPVVVSFHTLFGRSLLSRFDFLFMLLFCRGVISTNEEVSHILKKIPFYRNRFREIPIASNIIPPPGLAERKDSLREELDLPGDTCVLSNFGLFYHGKGLSTLLECCGLLRDRDFSFFLMLLGSLREDDGPYIQKVRDRISALDLQDHVRFYGEQSEEDTSRRLIASDIYVVPYDRGSSIRRGTLWTGFSHGLPVVTTIPAMSSQYISDKNTALVPPRSPEALAETIVSLHHDPGRRVQLATNALALCREFSWEPISERLEKEFLRQIGRTS